MALICVADGVLRDAVRNDSFRGRIKGGRERVVVIFGWSSSSWASGDLGDHVMMRTAGDGGTTLRLGRREGRTAKFALTAYRVCPFQSNVSA